MPDVSFYDFRSTNRRAVKQRGQVRSFGKVTLIVVSKEERLGVGSRYRQNALCTVSTEGLVAVKPGFCLVVVVQSPFLGVEARGASLGYIVSPCL